MAGREFLSVNGRIPFFARTEKQFAKTSKVTNYLLQDVNE